MYTVKGSPAFAVMLRLPARFIELKFAAVCIENSIPLPGANTTVAVAPKLSVPMIGRDESPPLPNVPRPPTTLDPAPKVTVWGAVGEMDP